MTTKTKAEKVTRGLVLRAGVYNGSPRVGRAPAGSYVPWHANLEARAGYVSKIELSQDALTACVLDCGLEFTDDVLRERHEQEHRTRMEGLKREIVALERDAQARDAAATELPDHYRGKMMSGEAMAKLQGRERREAAILRGRAEEGRQELQALGVEIA